MHNPNAFSVWAAEAAYNECDSWYKEMLEYVNQNDKFNREDFAKYMPEFHIYKRQGTYLLWVDYSALNISEKELERWFLDKEKVSVYMGSVFGSDSNGCIRINIASPRYLLTQAYEQMKSVYNLIKK